MPAEFPYDVFLSHSAKDKPVVRDVAERLRKDGLRVWFDEWEIRPGDSIPAKIEEGLERSRVLVLCMSANAFGSDWAQLESGTFRFRDPLNKERRFLPLRLDDAPIKGSLAQFLHINWLPTKRELDYPKFLEACHPLGKPLEAEAKVADKQSPVSYMSAKRFRIAFSFAGETKRDFVGQVANILATRFGRDAILYDKFHTPEFARGNLAFHLPELYEKQADLIVAVFCSDYPKKEWCGLEWNAIYGLLKAGNINEVMLTRFDRVEAKGLHGLAGYADLDDLTPDQTANLILERLALNEGHDREHYLQGTTTENILPLLGRAPLARREREAAQISISYDQEGDLVGIFESMPRVSVAVCSRMNFSNDVSAKFAGLFMKAGVNVGQCALGTSPLNQFPLGISIYRAEESVTVTATESIVRALAAIGLEAKIVPRPVWNDESGARFPLHVIFGHHPLIRETPLIATQKELSPVKPKPSNLSSSWIDPRVSYEETEQMIEVFDSAPKIKLHITSLSSKACEDGQEIMERAGWICEAFRKSGINVEISFWETLGSIPSGTSIWWVKSGSNNDMVERIIRAVAIKGLHPVEVRRPVSAGECEIELMIGRNPMRLS